MSQRLLAVSIVLAAALWLSILPAGALSVRVVTKTADTDDGVCNDDCSVREAVDVAGSGDTIMIPRGTFTLASEIEIDKGLIVAGAGKDASILQAAAAPGIADHRLFNITVLDENVTVRDLTMQNGVVTGTAAAKGGAILWSQGSGDLTILASRIAFNEVNADGPVNGGVGAGGAIYYAASGTLSIVDSIIADNQVTANGGQFGGAVVGGALDTEGAKSAHILRSALVRNHLIALGAIAGGAASGGAYFGGPVVVTDSTVSGNGISAGAGSGGAFFGPTEVSSSTIVDNEVRAGAASGGGFAGLVTARNSIVANNLANDEVNNCFGLFTSDGYNLMDIDCGVMQGPGDQIGTAAAPIDPLLGPLANNGGMTLTHSLLLRSPAIDRGNPAGCVDENGIPLTVDQRKFPRVVDGDGDGVAICDIGALEQTRSRAPVPVLGWLGLAVVSAGLALLGMRRAARAQVRSRGD